MHHVAFCHSVVRRCYRHRTRWRYCIRIHARRGCENVRRREDRAEGENCRLQQTGEGAEARTTREPEIRKGMRGQTIGPLWAAKKIPPKSLTTNGCSPQTFCWGEWWRSGEEFQMSLAFRR